MEQVLITGAAGFLGEACVRAFSEAGFSVRALVRDVGAPWPLAAVCEAGVFEGELPHKIDPAAFQPHLRAVVHCAYAVRSPSASERPVREINIEGTRRIREFARQSGDTQFVFVSSLAAHEHAMSIYGQSKWQLEQEMLSASDTIIKPGTILGNGGVFARTREMIAGLPIVPVLYPDRDLQIIWIGDAAQGIVRSVQRHLDGALVLAAPEPVRMREFYSAIGALDSRRKPMIPVPGDAALLAVRLMEWAGIRLPVSSENLLGIKCLQYFDPRQDMERLGLNPLSFEECISRLKDPEV